jgi:hypothetical protein
MGIHTAHKLTHHLTQVTIEEVVKIVQERSTRRTQTDKPTVDIDVSYLYRKLVYKDPNQRVFHIIKMSDMLCQLGLRVVLVCDGTLRHHSKRAWYIRQQEKYKKKIELYTTRCKIMDISAQINNTDSIETKKI